jgi:hypothetical protein
MVLGGLGLSSDDARRTVQRFREHDEQRLIEEHAIHGDEKKLIQTAAESAEELRRLFEADRGR